MNLSRLFKWNKPEETLPTEPNDSVEKTQVSNVVKLPTATVSNNSLDENPLDLNETPKHPIIKGLTNAPEIVEFFNENHFGLGRHNGANFKTKDAMEIGKKGLISKFQNTLLNVLENKQAKVHKVQGHMVATLGISSAMTEQLKITCVHLERDIKILNEQIESAKVERGWVLEALNKYELGYIKGLNDLIEFEFLAS